MENRKIETDRLILRRFKQEDAKQCFDNFGNDKKLNKFLRMFPLKNINEMSKTIEGYINANENNSFIWIIEKKSTGEPIGQILVDVPYLELGIGEIAYLVGSRFQGNGYAFEAVKGTIQYMFLKKNLYMVEAKYNENNLLSGKLLKKLNFKIDGDLRGRRIDFATNERNNLIICSITKEEYLQNKDFL